MGTQGEWQADPTGRHQYRWWDGTAWTDEVADGERTGTDPMRTGPIPPTPVRKRAKWPWVLAAIGAVFVVGFASCVALIGVGIDRAVDELNEQQQAHAITQDQFDALALGMSQAEVIAALGKEPESANEFVSEGVFSEGELRSGCIYYNRDGGEWGDTYQLCFDDDVLSSKNTYG